jgi:hypothetical protein
MAALERVDHLNRTLTQKTVSDLVDRRLSPFLDWLQREIAGMHGDIVEGFCGG